MSDFNNYSHPYDINPAYSQKAAYFCMEFGIDQALKIYSGGLGYLAGSHMRSAYALKQNLIGIGILWKYGYYEQTRKPNNEMDALFRERYYNFLEDTGIQYEILVNGHPVHVRAHYLAPEVFGTAPIFLLSTDVPENDHLARTISHRLYDNNTQAKIAQYILLGMGGARLLELLNWEPDVYHLNEAHGLPALFHLYKRLGSKEAVQERTVFTTHTPVEAGNEKHDLFELDRMSFFGDLPLKEVRELAGVKGQIFNQSLVALRLAKIANGVSAMHGEVSREMWAKHRDICPITHITNSQNHTYWHDPVLEQALEAKDVEAMKARKREMKENLFRIVADQTGKIFDPDVLTIVWARRFARYKRADLLLHDEAQFDRLLRNSRKPVQIIWAGKPYPQDWESVEMFNRLIHTSKHYPNMAVLTGYELSLSKALKQGSDIWLNTPRVTREASGTSGMTAAMNASINVSTLDGWIPEFAKHSHNAFIVERANPKAVQGEQDKLDRENLYQVLENEVLPTYYEQPARWWEVVQNSMNEVVPFFDSDRMATDYYQKLYAAQVPANTFV